MTTVISDMHVQWLRITLEAFGTEHKKQIIKALSDNGYKVHQAVVSI